MGSTKNVLNKTQVVAAGAMTGTSVITSSVVGIAYLDNVGVQLNFTGNPTGTFQVQVSADYQQDSQGVVTSVGNWVSVTLSPAPVASGAANQIYIDMQQLSAPFLRVVYTNASGTGVLNAFVVGKSV